LTDTVMETFLDDLSKDIVGMQTIADQLHYDWTRMFAGISGEMAARTQYAAADLMLRIRDQIDVLEKVHVILERHLDGAKQIERSFGNKISGTPTSVISM